MLKRGDRFLILRYSNGPYNCIQNHREVIDKLGYFWFGKIGVAPTEKTLSEKLSEDNPLVVLYCHGDAFICQLLEVSTKRPLMVILYIIRDSCLIENYTLKCTSSLVQLKNFRKTYFHNAYL